VQLITDLKDLIFHFKSPFVGFVPFQ